MAARETLDHWADTLDSIGELYCHVIDTVADLPEPKTDLAGTTSKGAPPPLPGGMKLVLAGPHNLYAPPDDTPHPGVFLEKWCGHVGRRSRSIPPTRTRALSVWQARLLWLRERLQWIESEDDFNAELRAVHGLLRSTCNTDRPSRAEEVADRWVRGENAMRELQTRFLEIGATGYMLTRDEAETIWPDTLDDAAWQRILDRKKDHAKRHATRDPIGRYRVENIARELGL